ncbi:alpha/beta hydrolase family esterase [Silanimonas sp.]|jgi:poly(3-hydroxybutyrate) depolymerase|uniref:alpha/beta hydrolase family esterase n=1 Tax=Silanimonas sp. TaxID=1929290 RepID=UPI0037C9BECD
MRFLDSSRPRRPQTTFAAGVVLALFLALLAIPGSGLRAQNPYPAGLSDQTMTVNGVVRQFRVHVPAGLTTPRAVVFVLHGGGGEGMNVANTGQHPLSVFRSVADREGFVVVYPGGLPAKDSEGKPGWVDCRADNTTSSGADDVGFLTALVERVRSEYGLTTSRMFMTGGSNGAQMTHAFAFSRADLVAAVATGAGSLPQTPLPGPCTTGPSRPLPILLMHGSGDPAMPWAGGCVANVGGACNRGRVISAEATRDRWLQINGLTGVSPTQTVLDDNKSDPGPANRFDYAGTTPMQWWRLDGAGHMQPSQTVLVNSSPTSGIQNRDIEFAEVVWAFFANQLPKADDTPVLQAFPDRVQGIENVTALLVTVLANDLFTPSRLASVSLDGPPTTGTVSLETQGTSTPTDDVLRYVPPPNWSGIATMAYRLCEAGRCSSPAQVSVQIAPVNGGIIDLQVPAQRGFLDVTLSGLRALPGVQFAATSLSAPVVGDLSLGVDAVPQTPWDNGRVGTAHVAGTLTGRSGSALAWQVFAEASGLGGDVDLYLGEDLNGDGQPSENELRCTSAMSAAGERCELLITVPAGGTGRYWAMLHNRGASAQTGRLSRYDVPLLSSDGSLVTTAPGILSAGAAFPLRVQWDDPTLLNGESRVGYVQMQLSGATQAVFPVKLTRNANDSSALALVSGEDRTLRLAGNGSHEQLFIDVPAGATQLAVTTASASNVDVYLARVPAPVAGSAVPGVALAPPRNQAQASGTTPGGNESVTVANPAAGRWYVTPVNMTASSATVVVRATVSGTAPVVRPGGYYNTGRSGHGLFLYPAGGEWAGLWYTYLQDSTPTWYYLQGPAPGSNGIWRGGIYRGTWVGGSRFLTIVGEATATPTGADAFTFSYTLDGQMGSEAFSAFGRGCPSIAGAPADISQHYFDPARSGTGYSAQVLTSPGPYEFYATFVYDARGVARFLVAEDGPSAAGTASLGLDQLTGFCPTCERTGSPTRTRVGSLQRTIGGGRLTGITVSAAFANGVPGAWNATDTLSMLDSQGRTQGCQP